MYSQNLCFSTLSFIIINHEQWRPSRLTNWNNLFSRWALIKWPLGKLKLLRYTYRTVHTPLLRVYLPTQLHWPTHCVQVEDHFTTSIQRQAGEKHRPSKWGRHHSYTSAQSFNDSWRLRNWRRSIWSAETEVHDWVVIRAGRQWEWKWSVSDCKSFSLMRTSIYSKHFSTASSGSISRWSKSVPFAVQVWCRAACISASTAPDYSRNSRAHCKHISIWYSWVDFRNCWWRRIFCNISVDEPNGCNIYYCTCHCSYCSSLAPRFPAFLALFSINSAC